MMRYTEKDIYTINNIESIYHETRDGKISWALRFKYVNCMPVQSKHIYIA